MDGNNEGRRSGGGSSTATRTQVLKAGEMDRRKEEMPTRVWIRTLFRYVLHSSLFSLRFLFFASSLRFFFYTWTYRRRLMQASDNPPRALLAQLEACFPGTGSRDSTSHTPDEHPVSSPVMPNGKHFPPSFSCKLRGA